jgi:hypothetical protein
MSLPATTMVAVAGAWRRSTLLRVAREEGEVFYMLYLAAIATGMRPHEVGNRAMAFVSSP